MLQVAFYLSDDEEASEQTSERQKVVAEHIIIDFLFLVLLLSHVRSHLPLLLQICTFRAGFPLHSMPICFN